MLKIDFEKRDKSQKLDNLKKAGKMPAVFYGRKEKSTPISVSQADFQKIWKKAGEFSIVDLMGKDEEHETLIKDVDIDPVSGSLRHADFYVVEKGKKLQVSVPLVFTGIAPAVKELGGILVKVIHELKIEAQPKDLPHTIEVDISSLSNFKSVVLAKDIKLTQGVSLVIGADEVVASIAEPVEEKEEEAAPVDLSQIENSLKKGKQHQAQ